MSIYNLPNDKYSNPNTNSIGSQYAADYLKDTSLMIQKITNQLLFDSAPKQFFDLKMLNMQERLPVSSDEWFYKEMGYQRQPLTATGTALAVSYPTTQSFVISSVDNIGTDMLIVYPDNSIGNVIAVDPTTNTITVRPLSNQSLPAVSANDMFAVMSSVEGDAIDGFANYFRGQTVERHGYVQLFSKAIRYGRVELFKYKNAGTIKSFLDAEKRAMASNFRLEMSNAFWNGQQGEIITADGTPAKTTGGVFRSMVNAGSPNTTATVTTVGEGLIDIAENSEFGEHGDVRFFFARNKVIRLVSEYFKTEKTRYAPNDMVAKLNLDEVNIGSSRIVFVPYDRFRDEASFPAAFASRGILLDPKNIRLREMWGPMSGETLSRKDGIPKTYTEFWMDANFGVEFNNPLACAWMDITGL